MQIKKLSLTYTGKNNKVKALDDVSLNIKQGEFVSVVGPSGCGKTTLLKILAGLIKPTKGIIINNECNVGIVFQQPVLLPWKTVDQNIALPLQMKGEKSNRNLIKMMGLSKLSKNYPHELSGGMQQRVAIARALIQKPKMLLMDEPFSALDEQLREKMNIELLGTWRKLKPTIIFVTHSLQEAVLLSDRIIVLTQSPGTIKKELKIDLPRPRTLEQKNTTLFGEYLKCLRSAMA